MAKRFTVSVSDELATKLAECRGQVSPSSVFQAAVQSRLDEIARLDAATGQTEEEAFTRLARERAEYESKVCAKEGRACGEEWARTAKYSLLKYAAEKFFDSLKEMASEHHCIGVLDLLEDKRLGDYFATLREGELECDSLFDGVGLDSQFLSAEAEAWIFGWCDAVYDFWHRFNSHDVPAKKAELPEI